MKRLILALTLLLSFSISAHAAIEMGAKELKELSEKPIGDAPAYAKRALVVGVTDYRFASKLRVPGEDAKAFAELLKTKMGFPPEAITLLTDAPGTPEEQRPTYTNLRAAVNSLVNSVRENSEVVIYYSGHGTRLNDQDWWVPLDGLPDDVAATCVNYDEFKNRLATKRPRRVLLVMDACRNLTGGKSIAPSGFGKGDAHAEQKLKERPQMAELLSCEPTEISWEGDPKDFNASVFTHYLIQGLSGAPDAMDGDRGVVTFDSLRLYVQGMVSQYVSNKLRKSQNPDGRASLGAMVLARAGSTPVGSTPAAGVASGGTISPKNAQTILDATKNFPTKTNAVDGAEMVFVPAGEFLMGATGYSPNTGPQRNVYLDGFWIYKTEVTVAQYKKYCAATGVAMPDAPLWGWHDADPMVNVNWEAAQGYCRWAGAALPTEAQWEKAARGTDGRDFVWGNEWPPTKQVGNLADATAKRARADWTWNVIPGYNDNFVTVAPVGIFPDGASPYGALDMAGNVWEMCADWFAEDYYQTAPARNPTGPAKGESRVIRGGSWWGSDHPLRAALRNVTLPQSHGDGIGFRCMMPE